MSAKAASGRRFKPYPAYKDSGVEWLGEIPAHWVLTKMWDVSRAISGGTPAKEERRYWDGDVPWVSPKDMKRRFIDSAEDWVTEAAITEAGLKLIPPPAVLVVVRGMILAHSYPVAITRVPVTINQDMKALQLRHDLDPEFFGYWLQGVGRELLAVIVDEAAHGTKAIRMDRWRVTPVQVPPRAEQRAIAAFLDGETARIDALVAKKERLIELLQEKRTALITRAVTKGLDPNVPMKDSGVEWLGEIPAHWHVVRSKRLFSLRNQKARPSDKQLTASQEHGVIAQEEFMAREGRRVVQVVTGADILKHVEPNDFVISMRSFQGGIEWSRSRGAISSAYVVLAPSQQVDYPYFTYLLKCKRYIQALQRTSNLVRDGQALRFENFSLVDLPAPPLHEQRAIAGFLDRETGRIDALVVKIRDAIEHLKELRIALISAAVTGKINVREEADRTSSVPARG